MYQTTIRSALLTCAILLGYGMLQGYCDAKVPLQDNPGFISPTPSTQLLPAPKPNKAELINQWVGSPQSSSDLIPPAKTITQVVIDDTALMDKSSQTTADFGAGYVGRLLSQDDLQALVDTVKKHYEAQGWMVAEVVMARSGAEDNVLRLRVIPVTLGQVEVEGKQFTYDWVVRRNFEALLKPGQPVNLKRLEKVLDLTNKQNHYAVKQAVLSADEGEPLLANLTLHVVEKQAWNLSPSYDDQGRPRIGTFREAITLTNQNVSGLGDRLSSTFIHSARSNATINAYTVPLDGHGDEFTFNYTRNSVDIDNRISNQPEIDGMTYAYGFTLAHPLNESRSLVSTLNYNYRLNRSTVNNVLDSDVMTHFIFGGLNFNKPDKYGSTFARLEGAVGVASTTKHKDIWRTTLTLNRNVNLPWRNQLLFRSMAQLTSDTLPVAQDIQLGGAYSVRGYTEGLINGDKGYFVSIEDRWPVPFLHRLSPYLDERIRGAVFYDMGQVWTSQSSPRFTGGVTNRFDHTFLASAGVGVRYRLTHYLTGFMDAGFGLVDRNVLEFNAQPTARVHFGIRSDLFQ